MTQRLRKQESCKLHDSIQLSCNDGLQELTHNGGVGIWEDGYSLGYSFRYSFLSDTGMTIPMTGMSHSYHRGLLSGLFDAKGSVERKPNHVLFQLDGGLPP